MCQGTDSSPARSPASCALSAAFCAFPPPWWLVSALAAPRKAEQRTRCSSCCQTAPSRQLLGWNWVVPSLVPNYPCPQQLQLLSRPSQPIAAIFPCCLPYSCMSPTLFSVVFLICFVVTPFPLLSHFSSCHCSFSPRQKHSSSANRYLELDQRLLLLTFSCVHESHVSSERADC